MRGEIGTLLLATLLIISVHQAGCKLSIHLQTKFVYYTTGTNLRSQVLVNVENVDAWLLEIDAGPPDALRNFMRSTGQRELTEFPLQFDWGQTNLFPTIAVVVSLTDLATNTTQRENLLFPVWELPPASMLIVDPEVGQRVFHLQADDSMVSEALSFVTKELSNTQLLLTSKVLQALLWTPFDTKSMVECLREDAESCAPDASEIRLFITVQTAGDQLQKDDGGGRKFLAGVRVLRGAGERRMELTHAEELDDEWLEEDSTTSIAQAIEEGTCPSAEPQIDLDLAPWAQSGGTISQDAVAHQALPEAWNRYCNRITIVNGSLSVVWAFQDQGYPPTARGSKWYTQLVLETLLSVLASFRVPDVDLCVAEETPQTLRASNLPSMAYTKSAAHMDILIPDAFFKYWDLPASLVPHPWYKPPQNLAALPESNRPWEERIAKVYWRGTVSEWAMNSRGRLCIVAVSRPDLFDVKPLRIVGDALRQRWRGIEAYQDVIDRGGEGTALDPAELFKYKFVVNTHGNGNEWNNRFRSLLSSGAVVFKQESTLYEFWEADLVPYQHYIPVRADMSDLALKVEWARTNDANARQIALNAAEFVRGRISYRRVECYWARLLTAYSRVQSFQPQRPPNASAVLNLALVRRVPRTTTRR